MHRSRRGRFTPARSGRSAHVPQPARHPARTGHPFHTLKYTRKPRNGLSGQANPNFVGAQTFRSIDPGAKTSRSTILLDYSHNGHTASTMLGDFPDLADVPYTGCH